MAWGSRSRVHQIPFDQTGGAVAPTPATPTSAPPFAGRARVHTVQGTGGGIVPASFPTGAPTHFGGHSFVHMVLPSGQVVFTCCCLVETFSRAETGTWGDTELGPIGWTGAGPGFPGDLSVAGGVGQINGSTNGAVIWTPGEIPGLRPPFEYGFDIYGSIFGEHDLDGNDFESYHYFLIGASGGDLILSVVWYSGPPYSGFVEGSSEGIVPYDDTKWVRVKYRVEPSAISGKLWYRDEPEPDNWHYVVVAGGNSQADSFYVTQFDRWQTGWGDNSVTSFDNIYFSCLQGDTIDSFLTEDWFGQDHWSGWAFVTGFHSEFTEAYSDGEYGAVYLDQSGDSIEQKITPTNVDLNASGGWRLVTAIALVSGNTSERFQVYNGDLEVALEINADGEVWLGPTQTTNIGTMPDSFHNLIWEYIPGVRSTIWLWNNLDSAFDKPPQPSTPTLETTDPDEVPLFGADFDVLAAAFGGWGEVRVAALNVVELVCCSCNTLYDDFQHVDSFDWGSATPDGSEYEYPSGIPAGVSLSSGFGIGFVTIAAGGADTTQIRLPSDPKWQGEQGFVFYFDFAVSLVPDTEDDWIEISLFHGAGPDPAMNLELHIGNHPSAGSVELDDDGLVDSSAKIDWEPDSVTYYRVKLERRPVSGTLRAKVWRTDASEPAGWLVSGATSNNLPLDDFLQFNIDNLISAEPEVSLFFTNFRIETCPE